VLLLAFVHYQLTSVWKTVLRNQPNGIGFLMFSSDYSILRSAVFGLKNFIQYNHCKKLF